ncbi:MAG: multicopper oxidase family protein [Pseudomonadota bacterium]
MYSRAIFPILGMVGMVSVPVQAYETAEQPTAVASIPNPCRFQEIDVEKWGGADFQNPPEVMSQNGVLEMDLRVEYGTATIAGCPVNLRQYNPIKGGPIVGPTLRLKPGDTMKIRLVNTLDDITEPGSDMHDQPGIFNVTNLHTHGLHVSPSGISDNVLLKVMPQSEQDYVIEVPENHPPGTYWYHAHVHGSTAIQVSSGMAGALIIDGGLDNVPAIAAADEKIFVLQQIAYGTTGDLESYDAFGPDEWSNSKRHVTINGAIMPVIKMRPGEVQRWRLVHGGVRETIQFSLEGHELSEIATDGIATGRMDIWGVGQPLDLNPGYRSDVLVKAKPLLPGQTEAVYYVLDNTVEAERSLQFVLPTARTLLGATRAAPEILKPERILAKVIVSGDPKVMPLPTSAELAPYLPFEPITDDELDGEPQLVSFSIERMNCSEWPAKPCTPCSDGTGLCATRFMVNNRPFSKEFTRKLKLGTASEWTLETAKTSFAPVHPFHIHVNPFEMQRTGPDGKPQTVWKDTVLVVQGQPLKVRSRYEDYTGKFVLHCHILDHEDEGMMELVEVVEK